MADQFPATYLQEWYATARSSSLRVAIPVEPPLLRALDDLVARHEALRTRLVRTGDGVRQEVAATATVPIISSPQPFQVVGGPLVHAVPDGTVYAHHAVCDGWSAGVVRRDLTELYRARVEGRDPVLPDLELQFADYAVWEHQARQRPVPEYWRTRLAPGNPRLRLGRDADHLPARLRGVPLRSIPPAHARELAGMGTTLPRALGALAVAAVRPYAGERLVVGQITSNRHRPELRDVVGDLWDQLPVVVEPAGTFAELVARYDAAATGAQDHYVPVAVLAPLLRPGSGPLFDLRVNHFPDIVPDGVAPRTHVVDRWWPGLSPLDFQYRTRPDGGVDCALLVNETAVPAERVEEIADRFAAELVTC